MEEQQKLQGEIAQYQQLESTAALANEALHQVQAVVNSATVTLAAAQGSAQKTQQASVEARNAAATQQYMVEEARQRIALILNQLQRALSDLQETESSASKAAEAAQMAQSNAEAAGFAVAAASAKGAFEGSHRSYHH